MEPLATELLEAVLARLPLAELLPASRVCRRWGEVAARRHFGPHLASRDWSVARWLAREGWEPATSDWLLTTRLFRRLWLGLAAAWEGRLGAPPPAPARLLVAACSPGEMELRVADIVCYRDKLYLACWRQPEGCTVRVYCLASLARRPDLAAGEADGEAAVPGPGPRSCQLAQHGRTLAVTAPDRHTVRLYDCATDVLVGQVESGLGPVYSLALARRTLVCLAGWQVSSWSLDSARPGQLEAQGAFPDFQPSGQFQSWLEAHGAALGSGFLATRATRLSVGARPPAACFLQLRRLQPATGALLPAVLRPGTAALGPRVLELADMCLGEEGLLATLTMERPAAGPNTPHYLVRVTNCETGEPVAELQQTDILSSVQMPVCWRDGHLYLKVVPQLAGEGGGGEEEEFLVSLARWEPVAGVVTALPRPALPSSSALLTLETARIALLSTELVVSQQEEPGFIVTLQVFDFWEPLGPTATDA